MSVFADLLLSYLLSMALCPRVCMPIRFIHLNIYLSVCMLTWSVCLSVWLSVSLYGCLFFSLSFCLSLISYIRELHKLNTLLVSCDETDVNKQTNKQLQQIIHLWSVSQIVLFSIFITQVNKPTTKRTKLFYIHYF